MYLRAICRLAIAFAASAALCSLGLKESAPARLGFEAVVAEKAPNSE